MGEQIAVLVGTRKGLYVYRGDKSRSKWRSEGPYQVGSPVYHAIVDPRDGRSVYAASNASWGGPRIEVSRDLGKTWKTAANPAFPAGDDRKFERTWHFEPGHPSQPNVMWAGTEPAALFKSEDRGETWSLVQSLDDQPTRAQWVPGFGGMGLHSIAVDAQDPQRMSVGISVGGVYTTTDGGTTWATDNEGIVPMFPDQPPVGHCIHKLLAHEGVPGLRFMKVHQEVYWREPGASSWTKITEGLPDPFGFAAAIHPRDRSTAYVIPLAGIERLAPPPGIAVWRTRDRGAKWERLAKGLPVAPLEVLREGMAVDRLDPAGVYFGTHNGEVWVSPDEGDSWTQVAQHLPYVLSVHAATIRD